MGIQENKELVLEFLRRQYSHDIDGAFELVADDATWWMPGALPVSGTYPKAEIHAIFSGVRDRFVEPPAMEITAVTAEDDRVAVEVIGRGTMRNGLEYDNSYHLLFEVRDGAIVSCHNHQDLDHLRRMLEAEGDAAPTGPAART
jgi:ketosteroid isomerase-like protein